MSVEAASVHTHSPDAEAIARLRETFDLQRAAFAKELYPELEVRKDRLRAAASMVLANRKRIADALQSDYATHPTVFGDVVEVLNPITRCLHVAQQLDQWAAEDVRQVDPAMFGTAVASSRYGPKGVIGNIVPWNFPFELGFGPMAEMLGAGNRVIIKPSDLTPACGELMAEMVAATFDRDLIAVSTGGLDLARTFSALPWDHLLYTGNPEIGREVALAAAENLTPLTVELGGKSPAVILPGGSTPEAARNVVGTKMVKNGQVCITVDYVLVPRAELDTFVQHAVDWVQSAVPQFADSDDCTGIITTRHLQRLTSMVQEAEEAGVRIVRPGNDHGNAERRQLPLTLVIDPPDTLRLMTEEIFGPILPIVPYDSVDGAVAAINAAERPLALYVFGADADAESVVRRTISGGVGINACAMQANNDVGFGGSGRSGYGRHHGIEGFREFSVQRGTFVRGENDAIDAFLPPYHGPVEAMVDAVFEQLGELLGTAATPGGLRWTEVDFALDPQDEFPHDPGTAANYNESMYLNAFDHAGGWGGWFRLGNRPNEGRAEVSVCLYLPDGRVAFSFSRSDISGNGELAAGGLRIDVVEPLQRLRFTFTGPCLLLDDPGELADPAAAYRTNQQVPVTFELDVEGIAPAWGGRPLAEDGSPLAPPDPEHSFAAAHYEQHVRVTGTVRVGTATYPMAGFGLRDKSWGPRHWAAVSWYRFLPVTFGDDLAMMLLVKDEAAAAGGIVVSGEVSRDGVRTPVRHCTIDTDWDATGRPTSLVARAELADGTSYLVHGDVLSLVPLRSRRTGSDGRVLTTRITESMTRFTCGDRVALGISEYLDQIVDGVPVGPDNPVIRQ